MSRREDRATLKTIDTFEIPGRGTAHVVDVSAFADLFDPRQLRGLVVMLDGEPARVTGVEAHCVEWPGALDIVSIVVGGAEKL